MSNTASRTTKHTPTPWLPSQRVDAIIVDEMHGEYQSQASVKHYGGYVVAESLTEDDRAFVLRACNAHEQLVAAAKAAEAVLARQKWIDTSNDPEAVALRKLREAIAAAEA